MEYDQYMSRKSYNGKHLNRSYAEVVFYASIEKT